MSSSIPNMATITASLERSLQNCSLNHDHHHRPTTRPTSSSSSSSSQPVYYQQQHDATLDLNSQISLPYHWEQCLDLKQSGEIYYINWRTGMKAKEDPRRSPEEIKGDEHYYYTDEEDEAAGSSSSSSSSRSYDEDEEVDSQGFLQEAASASYSYSSSTSMNESSSITTSDHENRGRQVLVVAGCKVCLMYFMLPKQVQLCPKCTTAQLLHFN